MRTGEAVATLLLGVLVVPTPATSESAPRAAVRIEGGLLINSQANYSFTVPPEWVLRDGRDYKTVEVFHPASGSIFSVDYERKRTDGNPLSQALAFSVHSPARDWRPEKTGTAKIAGHTAFEAQGTRTRDGTKERVRYLVTEVGDYTYLLVSAVPEAAIKKRRPEIDTIIQTFSFGRPPQAP